MIFMWTFAILHYVYKDFYFHNVTFLCGSAFVFWEGSNWWVGALFTGMYICSYAGLLTIATTYNICFSISGNLVLHSIQEDSTRIGSVSCAGMYFLHFQVYRIDATVNAVSTIVHWFKHVLENNNLMCPKWRLQ